MEMVSFSKYEELSTETETPRFGGSSAGLKTNRMKAIIFANLFSLFQFLTACSMKLVINEKHINALDISMMRNIVLLFTSYSMIRITGSSMEVNESQRVSLVQRSVAGTIAF